jgi:predicted CoA-binding protein
MKEMEEVKSQIERFLAAPAFAVVGASEDPRKYGHKCYRCYLQNGRQAYPVNPRLKTLLGNPAYPDLASLPEPVASVSIITPPAVTEQIVDQAIAAGVRHLWMQPGAESPAAIERARAAGLNVIANGPCLLVALGYREQE